jgi:hypothetical protein
MIILKHADLQPTEFFLFVLSHGEAGGVVLTSHPSKTEDARSFDSYSTSDIWNALDSIPALKLCPKILFLAVNYLIPLKTNHKKE